MFSKLFISEFNNAEIDKSSVLQLVSMFVPLINYSTLLESTVFEIYSVISSFLLCKNIDSAFPCQFSFDNKSESSDIE